MSKYQKALQSSEDEDELLAKVFAALSHPHRVKILQTMAASCVPNRKSSEFEARCCVGASGRGLDIAASTLSHHVKELRNAGLIRLEKCGQQRECWVEPKALEVLEYFFRDLRKGLQAKHG